MALSVAGGMSFDELVAVLIVVGRGVEVAIAANVDTFLRRP